MRGKPNPLTQTTRKALSPTEQERLRKLAWDKRLRVLHEEFPTITAEQLTRLQQNKQTGPDVIAAQLAALRKRPALANKNPILLSTLPYDDVRVLVQDKQIPKTLLAIISKTNWVANRQLAKDMIISPQATDIVILNILSRQGNNPNSQDNKDLWFAAIYTTNCTDRIRLKAIDFILGQLATPNQDCRDLYGNQMFELDAFLGNIYRSGQDIERIAKKLLARSGKMPRKSWSNLAHQMGYNYRISFETREKIKARYQIKPRAARPRRMPGIPRAPRGVGRQRRRRY